LQQSSRRARVTTLDRVSIAVFDIDGVVADVRHRVHHVAHRPKDWAQFFDAAAADTGIAEGIAAAHAAAEHHDIVWLTGRPNWLRPVTARWLADQGLPAGQLVMRADRDYRPAPVLKVAELRRLRDRDIARFVDDDPAVIAAATAAGFPATLVTWVPRSDALAGAQDRAGRT